MQNIESIIEQRTLRVLVLACYSGALTASLALCYALFELGATIHQWVVITSWRFES